MASNYIFGTRSEGHLVGVAEPLVRVVRLALDLGVMDFAVIDGRRGELEQREAFRSGSSQVDWPDSQHNAFPFSLAVDLAPWPIQWADTERFYLLAGVMLSAASLEGVELDGGYAWRWDVGHYEVR